MEKDKLKKLLASAAAKNLSNFRKGLKEVLAAKINKRLEERQAKIAKTIFNDGQK